MQPTKKKPSERLKEKIAEKERKAREEAEARKQLQEANMTPEEQLAEKLRRQKLVEEADLEVAMETFGISACIFSGRKSFTVDTLFRCQYSQRSP